MSSANDVATDVSPAERLASRRLTAVWNGGTLTRALAAREALTIGRSEDADVRVDDNSVSRRHVVLHVDEIVHVEDAGSANGTFLDGQRLVPGQKTPARLVKSTKTPLA